MIKRANNNIKLRKLTIIAALFCFVIIILRTGYIMLSPKVDNINLTTFAKNRDTAKIKLEASRGNIYDKNGNALAQNVSSYTLIAYLDPSRSKDSKVYRHVNDIDYTAKQLATVLELTEEQIKSYLSQKGLYQVELGPKAKNLTELTKDKIEELNLPGIDFVESKKRYYPNGNFASYVVGYAKKNDNGEIAGELGIEQLYNKDLKGENGSLEYQKDAAGYKIAGTSELRTDAKNGNDIYLTIDDNIQLFVEQALNDSFKLNNPEWMSMIVADAKTGAILASATRPSYDPNVLDITNYYDLNISLPFEPGSTMKIYTYMAAIENGTYDGSKTFKSGGYKVDSSTTISDWLPLGWGNITYDKGFLLSSNVGVINILNNFISSKILRQYFTNLGFGKKTGITLSNEASGSVNFSYKTEVYNAGFGQGITTTPMQHIQALTSIANDGIVLKPYIIDKIVDTNTNKVIYEGKREEVAKVASTKTINKLKDLMYGVVNDPIGTGHGYQINGYDIIGKTGTSQIYNEQSGKYYSGTYHVIRSIALMYPKDDPQIIIYAANKRTKGNASKTLTIPVKSVVENVSKYLNVFSNKKENLTENYKVENYSNKLLQDVINKFNNQVKYITIGTGTKIIDQYPKKDAVLNKNDTILLLTNSNVYNMPNLTNISSKEVDAFCGLLKIKCTKTGTGYVKEQNIKENTPIDLNSELLFTLK